MSRLYTGGAELGHVQAEGCTTPGAGGAPIYDTVIKRSGVASFKSTIANQFIQRALTTVLGRTYYFRFYYQMPANPTGLHRPFTTVGSGISLEMVNGTRVFRLLNLSSAILGTGTTAITAGQWYLVEIAINVPAAGNGTVELKLDGVVEIAATSASIGNVVMTSARWGPGGNIGGLAQINIDDIAINDDQGANQNSWPGAGSVYALLGVADPGTGTNTTNWTKPGGATTNRHTSVGKPLVYQADSTLIADAEKFVRNPTNAASQFEVDLTDYTAAGVPSGEKIVLVQPVAGTGSTSTTDTTGSLECLSNPVVASKALTTFDNGVASATVTTWPRADGDVTYNPTVTRGTRPRVRLSRASANRIVMCNMMALLVETAPAVTHYSASSLAITFEAFVDGDVITPAATYYGNLSMLTTFGAVVEGKRKAFGQIALPMIFSKEVQAQRKTFGQLLSPFIFGKEVSGQRKTFGQLSLPLSIAIDIVGIRVGLTQYGSVSLPVIFGKDIHGQRKAFGQIALPMTFSKDVQGQRETFGQITFPIIFTKESVGRKNVFGALSMQTLFGKEITGHRKTFSQLAMPMIFSKAVAGRKQTFGRVELPITTTIIVDGFVFTGPKTYYGQLALPIVFGKQVSAQRKTFGQIYAPLLFGAASQGQRRTFGEIELPIDFETLIKSGPVGAHGLIDLDLVLTMDTAGKIRIAGIILNDALDLYLGEQEVDAVYVGGDLIWP